MDNGELTKEDLRKPIFICKTVMTDKEIAQQVVDRLNEIDQTEGLHNYLMRTNPLYASLTHPD